MHSKEGQKSLIRRVRSDSEQKLKIEISNRHRVGRDGRNAEKGGKRWKEHAF